MRAEIIGVGDELLLGNIINENAQFLSKELATIGINIAHQSVVGSDPIRLRRTLNLSVSRSNLIIIFGGIGPLAKDITKPVLLQSFGLKPVFHRRVLDIIETIFQELGKPVPEEYASLAYLPKECTIFENKISGIPGFSINVSDSSIIVLPSNFNELKHIFNNQIKPALKAVSGKQICSHELNIVGLNEAFILSEIANFLEYSNPSVSFYKLGNEFRIKITACAKTDIIAQNIYETTFNQLSEIFENNIYGVDMDGVEYATVQKLSEKNIKIATAESCTAGMLSSCITEVPGASNIFSLGLNTYSNDMKISALGVNKKTIENHGPVSPETAAEMAIGIKNISGADIGISVTGVAGPENVDDIPAGTVFIAMTDGKNMWIQSLDTTGIFLSRSNIRTAATTAALDLCRRYAIAFPKVLPGATAVGKKLSVTTSSSLSLTNLLLKKETLIPDPTSFSFSDEDFMNQLVVETAPSPEVPYANIVTNFSQEMFITDELPEEDSSQPQSYDNSSIKDKKIKSQKKFFPKKLIALFPSKKDGFGTIIRKTIFLLALFILIFSSVKIIAYFIDDTIQKNNIDNVRSIYSQSADNPGRASDNTLLKFQKLLYQNNDFAGWLYISNTNINNPVYQTNNNNFYLNHNMLKKPASCGSLFLDSNTILSYEKNSQNLVIFGHNMKNGSMFGTLKKFRDISFYKQNPIISFDSKYKTGQYKIFSIFLADATGNDDSISYMTHDFPSQTEFVAWANNMSSRSLIITGVDVAVDDEILTLSTCTEDFNDARLIVMARRVRPGETSDVNTSLSKINTSPVYPDAWYQKKNMPIPKRSVSTNSTEQTSSASSITPLESITAQSSQTSKSTSTSTSTSSSSTTTETSSNTNTNSNQSSSTYIPSAPSQQPSSPATSQPSSSSSSASSSESSTGSSSESSTGSSSDQL